MELTNDFRVGVPVEEAWTVLTDVPRIAPCLPGAELREVEGEEYRGVVKVKVGPITAEYKGKATFLERDVNRHRAVLRAEGRETRGQGNANATITAQLEPAGEGTLVTVVTDLAITGRVAQFGRGVLADVSAKLLGQFVDSLESTVLGADADTNGSKVTGSDGGHRPESSAQPSTPERPEGAITQPDRPSAEPVDLVQVAGGSVARRVAPWAGVGAGFAIVWWLIRHPRRRG